MKTKDFLFKGKKLEVYFSIKENSEGIVIDIWNNKDQKEQELIQSITLWNEL